MPGQIRLSLPGEFSLPGLPRLLSQPGQPFSPGLFFLLGPDPGQPQLLLARRFLLGTDPRQLGRAALLLSTDAPLAFGLDVRAFLKNAPDDVLYVAGGQDLLRLRLHRQRLLPGLVLPQLGHQPRLFLPLRLQLGELRHLPGLQAFELPLLGRLIVALRLQVRGLGLQLLDHPDVVLAAQVGVPGPDQQVRQAGRLRHQLKVAAAALAVQRHQQLAHVLLQPCHPRLGALDLAVQPADGLLHSLNLQVQGAAGGFQPGDGVAQRIDPGQGRLLLVTQLSDPGPQRLQLGLLLG